jgi:hypothetical protein
VLDVVGDPAHRRRDHREPEGHRLEQDERHAFAPRGEAEHLGVGVALRKLGPVLHARELDGALDAELLDVLAQHPLLAVVLLLADEAQRGLRPGRARLGQRRDELGAALALAVATDEKKAQRPIGGRGRAAVRRDPDRVRDPVRLDADSAQCLDGRGRKRDPAVDEAVGGAQSASPPARGFRDDVEVSEHRVTPRFQNRKE